MRTDLDGRVIESPPEPVQRVVREPSEPSEPKRRGRPPRERHPLESQPLEVREGIERLSAIVRAQIDRLASGQVAGGEIGTQAKRAIEGLRMLAQLQGHEFSEREILMLPQMRPILDRVVAALAEHPAALRAVREALVPR